MLKKNIMKNSLKIKKMNQLTVSSKINLLTLLDAPSENNEYEEDEFEDENALGIQNLDDEDNDYDDEQFEQ